MLPQVPGLFARAVPEHTASRVIDDPPVSPVASEPQVALTTHAARKQARLAAAGKPLELWVPRLGVRSPVVPISGQSGELVPPNDPQILGWWREGREAGAAQGSVVVTGHTVSTGGGAFDHLGELVARDRIRVRTAAGWITYVVEQVNDVSVAKVARTAAAIFRQTGDPRLVLITCSDFDGRVYRSSSVVYAIPVADRPAARATG
ncbi:MAG: class sortase [Marmoricola sp.]|nr:class sortase [Marmoricola sp.]